MTTSSSGEILGLSATEVCRFSGITYRQLDYWITAGYMEDPRSKHMRGSGIPRRFPPEAVARAKEIKQAIEEAEAILTGADLSLPAGYVSAKAGRIAW